MLLRDEDKIRGRKNLIKCSCLLALLLMVIYWTVARAQHPMLDAIANKVIQKYEQTPCEQLGKQKGQPKTPREQEALQLLRSDPQLRTQFINKVAAPIANKMFECGMIP